MQMKVSQDIVGEPKLGPLPRLDPTVFSWII